MFGDIYFFFLKIYLITAEKEIHGETTIASKSIGERIYVFLFLMKEFMDVLFLSFLIFIARTK